MRLPVILSKLSNILQRRENSLFTYPVKKQMDFMDKLGTPENDWERSYFQYRCQMELNGRLMGLFLNLLSLPLILYYSVKKSDAIQNRGCEAVFLSERASVHVIPEELKREYTSWITRTKHGEYFSDSDKKYFRKLVRRYPFSWHFLLKCLIKIRFYSYEIQCSRPQALVVCAEYSYTASVLSDYCRSRQVKHVNVMHGEKLFHMVDSFFRFDRCYVWNEAYVQLFIALRAESGQFVVALPASMRIKAREEISKEVDFTYYLGAEKRKDLEKISKSLSEIQKKGYTVAVRPHPIYSDLHAVSDLFKGAEIEAKETLAIENSILRTRNAISGYSTVLSQAYNAGVNIVIDDETNPEHYRKLKELQYNVLSYRHRLLSDLRKEIAGEEH